MSADPSAVIHPAAVPSPIPPVQPAPRAISGRESPVRILQLGPSLEMRGGISTVEQLICDYLPSHTAIRQIDTIHEGNWFRRTATFVRACHTLWRAMESLEPTVVHIHFASRGSTLRKLLLAQLVVRARRPLILHAHGGSFDDFHRALPPLLRRMVNRALQQANLVITLSNHWRDFYVRECELAPSQVVVLANPVKVPARVVDRAHRAEVKFVHLAKLGQAKGSYDLVDAFKALPPELHARARLVLAGHGETEELRAAAAGDDRIEVRSWIGAAERDRLLDESDVFVLPSYFEGVPMSLLEAMAAGLPSIATPVGGIPDVFTDGADGLLVPPGDVPRLTAAMARLITDPALRLEAGHHAHERARAHDVHAYARRLAEHYQRIAPVAEWRVEA